MSTTIFMALTRGPAAYVPKTGWGPWSAVAATVVIFVVAASLGFALCELFFGFAGNGSMFDSVAEPGIGSGVDEYGLVWTIVMQVLLVALTIAAARFFRSNPTEVLAIRVPAQGWGVLVPAVGVLFLVLGVCSGIGFLVWPETALADIRPFREMLASGQGWLLAIAGIVGAPISEELLFRGFLLSALAQSRLGFVGAMLVSNAAWTGLHAQYSLIGLGEVFLVGLVQSWLLWRTGSLWVPIISHAIYNGLLLLAFLLVPLNLISSWWF